VRRVQVIGGSCSGKSTTSRRLAAILGFPSIELDALHHDPGWTEASAEVFRARVADAIAAAPDGWVVDGNYFGKLDSFVLDQADTIVWLDIPYRTAVRRVLWRTFHRSWRREELWNGNRETFRIAFSRDSIVLWVLRTHRGFAAKWGPRLEGRNVVRVTDVEAFLQSIQATESMSGSSKGSERQKTPPFAET
jgi:adenylate kinase family enzyme